MASPLAALASAQPLPCPGCESGIATEYHGPSSRSFVCPDCHGLGTVRCETADCLDPATRTAQGDADIKLCAACGVEDDAAYAATKGAEVAA